MKGTPETPQCGFSRAAIQILGLQGVNPQKFTAFNVLEDEELRAGMFRGDPMGNGAMRCDAIAAPWRCD
jgi:glutaredoxin-related protein